MKKKIVIFNGGYFPAETFGGPVISIGNLVKTLNTLYDFVIICSAYELNGEKKLSDIRVNEFNTGKYNEQILYLDSKHYNFSYIKRKISSIKDITLVYSNSFFSAKQNMLAYRISRNISVPLLVAPRGELEPNALAIKHYRKKIYTSLITPFIQKNDKIRIHATTETEKENMICLGFNKERIYVSPNIPTIPDNVTFNYMKKEKNKLNMIFVSRIQTKKNLKFAINSLHKISSEILLNYDIYGPIENREYWEECKKNIDSLPSNINVEYKGTIKHEDIFDIFSNYDLFYFPTLSENFGHVIAESLLATTPILVSDQTPWNDVNQYDAGKAYPLASSEKYVEYIEYLSRLNNEELLEVRENVKKYISTKYNLETLISQYIKMFRFEGE